MSTILLKSYTVQSKMHYTKPCCAMWFIWDAVLDLDATHFCQNRLKNCNLFDDRKWQHPHFDLVFTTHLYFISSAKAEGNVQYRGKLYMIWGNNS